MGAWHFSLFLLETPLPITFLVLGGGGVWKARGSKVPILFLWALGFFWNRKHHVLWGTLVYSSGPQDHLVSFKFRRFGSDYLLAEVRDKDWRCPAAGTWPEDFIYQTNCLCRVGRIAAVNLSQHGSRCEAARETLLLPFSPHKMKRATAQKVSVKISQHHLLIDNLQLSRHNFIGPFVLLKDLLDRLAPFRARWVLCISNYCHDHLAPIPWRKGESTKTLPGLLWFEGSWPFFPTKIKAGCSFASALEYPLLAAPTEIRFTHQMWGSGGWWYDSFLMFLVGSGWYILSSYFSSTAAHVCLFFFLFLMSPPTAKSTFHFLWILAWYCHFASLYLWCAGDHTSILNYDLHYLCLVLCCLFLGVNVVM